MMWEQIKQSLRVLFSYTSSVSGAAVGLFVYPAARLFRLAILTSVLASLLSFAIPILAGAAGYYIHRAGFGVMGSILFSVGIAAGLTGFVAGVMPVLFAYAAVQTLFTAPIEGVKKGWKDGLFSLLANTIRIVFGMERPEHQEQQGNHTRNVLDLFGLGGFDYNHMLEQLANGAANAARQPLTEDEFNRLEISAMDLRELKRERQPPLTAPELKKLEPSAEEKSKISAIESKVTRGVPLLPTEKDMLKAAKQLESYKTLQNLKTDSCSILAGRPERADTILLVKQYQTADGQWLPVPGAAKIFDKDGLKSWFVGSNTEGEGTRGNAIHPMTRDNIKQPEAYKIDDVEYATRYVMHLFYAADDASEEGLSQEMNILTPILRARAQQMPNPDAHHDTAHDHGQGRFGMGSV